MLVIIFLVMKAQMSHSGNGSCYFALGKSDFSDVTKSNVFVDKSMLIKEFFGQDYLLVTAPRRFGKTTNMDMIKRFCEVSLDQSLIDENQEIFSKNNLSIYEEKTFFDKHFGKYPVIHLDFNQLDCISRKMFLESFKDIVAETYSHHEYLMTSDKLSAIQKYKFKQFYIPNNTWTLSDLRRSVKTLSNLLYTFYNRSKCVILIDEFDSLLHEAIDRGSADIDQIVDFVVKFISTTLRSNSFVYKALLNARVRLSSVLTGDSDIKHVPFLGQSRFSKYYGFMESEVGSLLDKMNITDKINDVKTWYAGYKVEKSLMTIYNMFSTVNYLESRQLKNYWARSGTIRNMRKLFTSELIRGKVEAALEYCRRSRARKGGRGEQGVTIKNSDIITIDEVKDLQKLINREKNYKLTKDSADLFFQYLTDQGYFNVIRTQGHYATVRIPNAEIKDELEKVISSELYYKRKFRKNYKEFVALPYLFYDLSKRNSTYIKIIKILQKLYSPRGLLPKSEFHLQFDLYSTFIRSELFQSVEKEVSIGDGRLDILLTTKDHRAVLIELKMSWKTAYKALYQIVDKKYYDVLQHRGIKRTIFVGLHINDKAQCTISYLVNSTDVKKAVNLSKVMDIT